MEFPEIGDAKDLRRALTKITLEIRRSRIKNWELNHPISIIDDEVIQDTHVVRRKKIILAAPGCSAPTCTMCHIPNMSFYKSPTRVSPNNLISQFDSCFQTDPIDGYTAVGVYNSGNWFADKEIPSQVRNYIYQIIESNKCETLMVESLPQYITLEKVLEAKQHLKNKNLVVAIGLQSANDFVREVCINTTCTKQQFERASRLLRKHGYSPRVYIMLKPPFLTEKEAIEEVISSAHYLNSVGYESVSVSPTRIAPYTLVYELANLSMFTPPFLWTIVEAIKGIKQSLPKMKVRVSDLDRCCEVVGSDFPSNCEKCSPKIIEALKCFNIYQDINIFETVNCLCKEDYHKHLELEGSTLNVLERINSFISAYKVKDCGI